MPLFHRCWSQVGKRGGKQQLSLGSGCENKGRAIHELMHALGFLHEQSRQDRDEHVIILYQNIQDGECTCDCTVQWSYPPQLTIFTLWVWGKPKRVLISVLNSSSDCIALFALYVCSVVIPNEFSIFSQGSCWQCKKDLWRESYDYFLLYTREQYSGCWVCDLNK